jgi:hypothetical protein
VLKLLPKSVLGNVSSGRSESYILERSTIDIKEGWMHTESRNLDWTGILSVVESQKYHRDPTSLTKAQSSAGNLQDGTTGVSTTVMFISGLGERLRRKVSREDHSHEVDDEPKKGLLASWSTSGVQRSIEAIASRKTENQLGKSKMGMMVVLERLRNEGLVGVVDGMRKDRERLLMDRAI